MVTLHIQITDEEMQYIGHLAQEEGFETAEAFVKSRVLEPTKSELLNDIRQGLLAAKRGDPMPSIHEIWLELERDDESASWGYSISLVCQPY